MSKRSVYSEIQSQLRRNGYTISDAFEDIDIRGEGFLTENSFRRLFINLRIWIQDEQFSQLVAPFNKAGKIDYKAFIQDYENTLNSSAISPEDLQKLGKKFQLTGYSLQEALSEADRYHTGRISKNIFLSIVGRSEQTSAIADAYLNPSTQEVSYLRLSSDVEKAMALPAVEQESKRYKPTPEFAKLVQGIRIQGIDPYQYFLRYDRYKHGKISMNSFMSAASSFRSNLSLTQLQEIATSFESDGQFDYQVFCREVDSYQIPSQTQTVTQPIKPSVDPQVVINDIKERVRIRHGQLPDRLRHFDPRHTGVMSSQQFLSILASEKYELLPEEQDALLSKFGPDPVNYESFISEIEVKQPSIDSQIDDVINRLRDHLLSRHRYLRPLLSFPFTPLELVISAFRTLQFDVSQREIQLLRARFTSSVDSEELCTAVDPPPEIAQPAKQEEKVPEPVKKPIEVLKKLKKVDFMYDLFLREGRRSLYSIGTVRSALARYLKSEEIEELVKCYGNQDRVNMMMVDADLEQIESEMLPVANHMSDEIHEMLKMIKCVVIQRQQNLVSMFRAYDRRKQGFVEHDRLAAVVSLLQLELNDQQISELADAFKDDRMPEQVSYMRLVAAVEDEKVTDEDKTKVAVKNSFSSIEEQRIDMTIGSLHNKLAGRRKKANCVFGGLNGPIKPSEFRERYENYGFISEERDVQLVMKKYTINLAGEIDWESFARDVDGYKNRGF